jgi:hypothetical protein
MVALALIPYQQTEGRCTPNRIAPGGDWQLYRRTTRSELTDVHAISTAMLAGLDCCGGQCTFPEIIKENSHNLRPDNVLRDTFALPGAEVRAQDGPSIA